MQRNPPRTHLTRAKQLCTALALGTGVYAFILPLAAPSAVSASAQAAGQTRCNLPSELGFATEDKLPLSANRLLIREKKYVSPSGKHYLIFQKDNNLAVYTSAGQWVWSLDKATPNYKSVGCIGLGKDGNLVAVDAKGGFLWGALAKDTDSMAQLTLTDTGKLGLVSNGRGWLWASDGNLKADAPCLLTPGWTSCRKMADPKITIIGASTVSKSALDLVQNVYTQMTAKLSPKYPKNKMDGFVVYLTNGGDWATVSKLEPVGSMWPGTDIYTRESGNTLRGGAGPDDLWIDEQMICKTGVATYNQEVAKGLRPGSPVDNTVRTLDQVVHEFAHSLDYRYGWEKMPNYPGVEEFAADVQFYFGTPKRDASAFTKQLFTAPVDFAPLCAQYKP